jgi:hypothetical protein
MQPPLAYKVILRRRPVSSDAPVPDLWEELVVERPVEINRSRNRWNDKPPK